MGHIKKYLFTLLLVINIYVLAQELYNILSIIPNYELLDDFSSFEYFYLLYFSEHFVIKFALIILIILTILFYNRRSFDITEFLKQALTVIISFVVISSVISVYEVNNVVEYLNIIWDDLLIGLMLLSLILVKEYGVRYNDIDHNSFKIILIILVFTTPVLRIFGFGRQVLVFLLKPSFFWGVSGGLIFLLLVLFSINPQTIKIPDNKRRTKMLNLNFLFEVLIMSTLLLTSYFEREIAFGYIVIMFMLLFIGKGIFKACGLTKLEKVNSFITPVLLIVGTSIVYIIDYSAKNVGSIGWLLGVIIVSIYGIFVWFYNYKKKKVATDKLGF